MQATAEKLDRSRVRLQVEVGTDDLKKEYDRAVRRVAGRVNIRGFRKGKAPRSIIESYLGVDYVMRDLVDNLVPRVYGEAVQQTGVTPIADPTLDMPDAPTLEKPLVFSAEVAVAPTAALGDLTDVHVATPEPEVTDAEVEADLEQLRRRHGTWEAVSEPAALGRMIQAQIEVRGEGLTQGKPQPYQIILGENGFPAGFDAAVVGLGAGQPASFTADIPADDPNVRLRGKHVTFAIQIEEVRERRLPELDDAFAMLAGRVESLDALRARVRAERLDQKRHELQHKLEEDALAALVERSTFDIPDVLIDRERDALVESQTRSLVAQGLAVDSYLAMTEQSREEWQAAARVRAERNIRHSLALDATARANQIEVSRDALEAEATRIAEFYPEDRRGAVRRSLLRGESRERIESNLRNRAALNHVVAKVTGGHAPLHDHHDHAPEAGLAATAEAAAAGIELPTPEPAGPSAEIDRAG